ncbi:hypothetical protein DFJ58DRAFT_917000 [Suillus subalutaceus]|uniref:uncharacterized protein n=1 Tax=Suillus subalutaceus TaxID=48586 RepID=UPI001B879A56|nr:uncharacterized protein DFJ58DRAFT_917000 [Suillus subalutaceus]KAG1839335.1 hypothetical protein DFJ58DRAFT_917000 [Suillus subalutaceus]
MPANTNDVVSADLTVAKTDLQGLELAEHHFGPLLRPTRATKSAWTNYSINRLQTNQEYRTVIPVPRNGSEDGSEEDSEEDEYDEYSDKAWLFDSVKACVSQIEGEMGFEDGTLRMHHHFMERNSARRRRIRIYSPTAPMYIDVHFQYYCRSRLSEVEWFYSLGYKIQRRLSATAGNALAIKKNFKMGSPPEVHTRNGWQTLCWGYYDDSDGNYGKRWRRIECGEVELHQEGVMDVHEALFGELEKPAETDAEAMLAYQRSLVRGIRLLLAAVGISYDVACTDGESDRGPHDLMLEGLSDKWVGRGIRNACGLRLARDAEEERKGAMERQEEVKGFDEDDDDDDDEGDYDDDYGF